MCTQTETQVKPLAIPDKQAQLSDKFRHMMKVYDAEARKQAQWCYDTPGVVNEQQVLVTSSSFASLLM